MACPNWDSYISGIHEIVPLVYAGTIRDHTDNDRAAAPVLVSYPLGSQAP